VSTKQFTTISSRSPALWLADEALWPRPQHRILWVLLPAGRVVDYVLSNARQIVIVADYALVVVALPQPTGEWLPAVLENAGAIFRRRQRFETMNDIRQRYRRGNPL
jgi:hypothetical protein